jgi:hypothetical protein
MIGNLLTDKFSPVQSDLIKTFKLNVSLFLLQQECKSSVRKFLQHVQEVLQMHEKKMTFV